MGEQEAALQDYSSLRTQRRIALADAAPLDGPMAVYFEPTNICNFKCVFCPESFDNYKEKAGGLFQLTEDDFHRVADQIGAMGTVKTLNFYMMGEPFANRRLISFVRHAKQHRIADKVIVTSNGTLLTAEKYGPLCESGLDYLRVSVYGADQDLHRRNTQSPIPLSRVVANVGGLRRYRDDHGLQRPRIYVKMIDSQDPAANRRFLDTFEGIGDEVVIEPVMNWNDPQEGNLAQVERDVLADMPQFAHRKKVCPFPFYTLVIHSDLRVSVCCVDWEKKAVIGSLRENTLQELWRGERLREFQLMHLRGRRTEIEACRSCTYLHTAPDNLDGLTAEAFLARSSAAA